MPSCSPRWQSSSSTSTMRSPEQQATPPATARRDEEALTTPSGWQPPPWVWERLPPEQHHRRWANLVAWVQWLEQAYAPWVVLPACWPAHDGLRAELVLFWYWHSAIMSRETDPAWGTRWHAELRNAAQAWRELATCEHRQPRPEQRHIQHATRAQVARYAADAAGLPELATPATPAAPAPAGRPGQATPSTVRQGRG